MSITNTQTTYGSVTKSLHWLTALLILTAIPLGIFANDASFATSDEIAQTTRERGFSHFTSHASDPLTVGVGLAVVRTLVANELAARADEMGKYLMSGLRELQDRFEAIGDVRGRGLLIGVEIVTDRVTRNPDKELMARLSERCYELGLNINRVGGPLAVWRIAPPLTITKDEIDQALSILDEAFSTA